MDEVVLDSYVVGVVVDDKDEECVTGAVEETYVDEMVEDSYVAGVVEDSYVVGVVDDSGTEEEVSVQESVTYTVVGRTLGT